MTEEPWDYTTEAVCEVCSDFSFCICVDIGGTNQDDERMPICDECASRISELYKTVMDEQALKAQKKLGWR